MIFNYTLKNGIRVVVNKLPGMFSSSIGILVGVGSTSETPEESGISHFIEHVTFKGTKKRTSFDISNESDMLGAQINAYTSKEMTCYYIKSTSDHTDKAFEILSDIFVNSVYKREELDRERGVIIEEINMYEDTPDDVCVELLSQAYFGELGFGAPILGPKENIKRFTKKDINAFKRKYYTTDNIVVSVSGGVDEVQFLELCEKYLGGLKTSKKEQKPAYNTINLQKHLSKHKDIEQVHFAIAYPGVEFLSPHADAFLIASAVLGGGMSSRLYQTVREKLGLCYSIYSYASSSSNCGSAMIYAGVNAESINPAFEAVMTELKKLKAEGICDEEFIRSREQMKSSLVFAQESTVSQMLLYGKRLLLVNEHFDFAKRFEEITTITKNDVNGYIDGLLNVDSIATAVVGRNVNPLK